MIALVALLASPQAHIQPVRTPAAVKPRASFAARPALGRAFAQLSSFPIRLLPVPDAPPLVTRHAADGVDPERLEALLKKGREEKSDAILILRDGKEIAASGVLDEKIMAMSATKSIVSLAVGMLIEEGKIKSLDQPVADFYPVWSEGEKAKITVRMLLNHTSGLNRERVQWDDPEGVIAHALSSPQEFSPGTAFSYNNNATDLLAGVIERASGERADLYIARKLFAPLGISDWDWSRDALGTPRTAGELLLRPRDLAKIGRMVLDGGVWNGRRVISREWLELSAKPSQPYNLACGLLWWVDRSDGPLAVTEAIFESWRKAGLRAPILDIMRPLIGRPMKDWDAFRAALADAFRGQPELREEFRETLVKHRLEWIENIGLALGFSAQGWLGQYLVIDPARRLVGVRMRRARQDDYENPSSGVDNFGDFPEMVHRLIPAP